MLNLAQLARDFEDRFNPPMPPSDSLTLQTPVRFDPGLVDELMAQHNRLSTKLITLAHSFENDRAQAWSIAHDCTSALHELRRREALWLYPVIAHRLDGDALAKRRFVSLRLLMNSLARQLLRRIEELARAVHHEPDISAAIATVNKALADYRRRNELEVYPLYNWDRRQAVIAAVA